MNLIKAKILLIALLASFLPLACSQIDIHRTECAVPSPNASPNVPPPFTPNATYDQACLAIHNQSQTNVTVTLTHNNPAAFDMQNTIMPQQTAYFFVPAGKYHATETYPVNIEHQGNTNFQKGRCYEWLVGQEPQDN
ncbi:MAG: hypothetical protein JW936_02910 [Sedimentisphaerales bacterium]|nr:hypothetical protein [Sedimentisphaerales bacterium]